MVIHCNLTECIFRECADKDNCTLLQLETSESVHVLLILLQSEMSMRYIYANL